MTTLQYKKSKNKLDLKYKKEGDKLYKKYVMSNFDVAYSNFKKSVIVGKRTSKLKFKKFPLDQIEAFIEF